MLAVQGLLRQILHIFWLCRFLPSLGRHSQKGVEGGASGRIVGLGWADFDLDVPPSCPGAQPINSAKFPSAQGELARQ